MDSSSQSATTILVQASPQPATASETRKLLARWPVRAMVLSALFTIAAAYEAAHISALADLDLWWHLRTGLWILRNHAVPYNALFSQFSQLPWITPNWAFDTKLALGYRIMGLRMLPITLMACKVILAVLLYVLARRARANFWMAVVLAGVGQFAIAGTALSKVCSPMFFALELVLIFASRRKLYVASGLRSTTPGAVNPRLLFWLPLLFLLWANFDNMFLYGLAALLLFLLSSVIQSRVRLSRTELDAYPPVAYLKIVGVVTAASFMAVLLTPYGFRLYTIGWDAAISMLPYMRDAHAMAFRQPQDYLVLLLGLLSFFALGRRRSRDPFQLVLLIACMGLAFLRQRDTWLLAITAVALIGHALPPEGQLEPTGSRSWKMQVLATSAVVGVIFAVGVFAIVPGNAVLMKKLSGIMPVQACNYIRNNDLPQPLFNSYDWGSFLMWYLPEYPVSLDTRPGLYPDEMIDQYFNLTLGKIPLNDDPSFASARTIVLPKSLPMAIGLGAAPQFQVVYEDDVAVVLRPAQ